MNLYRASRVHLWLAPSDIAAIEALPVPPHPRTSFDEAEFRSAIAHSVSFTPAEKAGMIAAAAVYTQAQINTIFIVLLEEELKFNAIAVRILAARETDTARENDDRADDVDCGFVWEDYG